MKSAKLGTIALTLALLFLVSPFSAFAAVSVTITNAPSTASINEEFAVTFSASGLEANTQYYGKIRLGTTSPYPKGETKNGDSWFGDSASFSKFPTFTTDETGSLNGNLVGRAKSTTEIGTNKLFVRLRKVGSSSNVSPDGETTINVTQGPTATAVPSPTVVSSSTPTATKTPTPTKIPTSTKTPTPTKAPTSAPTVTVLPSKLPTSVAVAGSSGRVVTKAVAPTAVLAAAETARETPVPTTAVKTLENKYGDVSKVLIGVGLLFLAACGILAFRSYKKRFYVRISDE